MKASLRAAGLGGVLVALGLVLGAGPGSAQGTTSAPPPAAPPASTAPTASAPAPSGFEAAAAKADPDCKVADVSCAWSHCNPRPDKFSSYNACVTESCKVTDQACMGDLIMDLSDPDRQKTNGQS